MMTIVWLNDWPEPGDIGVLYGVNIFFEYLQSFYTYYRSASAAEAFFCYKKFIHIGFFWLRCAASFGISTHNFPDQHFLHISGYGLRCVTHCVPFGRRVCASL